MKIKVKIKLLFLNFYIRSRILKKLEFLIESFEKNRKLKVELYYPWGKNSLKISIKKKKN